MGRLLRRSWIASGLLFFIAFGLFISLELQSEGLADPDGYFHIKYAALLVQFGYGAVHAFPWLTASTWSQDHVDLQFGYHILLTPFSQILHPLVIGAKISAAFFSALFVTAVYFMFRFLGIQRPLLWCVILLVSSGTFLLRLTFPRAFIFGVLLTMVGLLLIQARRYWALGAVAFLFAWLYVAAPLLLIVAILSLIASFILKKTFSVTSSLVVLLGLFVGYMLRPDFPPTTFFSILVPYFERVKGVDLAVGAENSPLALSDLLSGFPLVLSFFLACTILCVWQLARRVEAHQSTDEKVLSFSLLLVAWFFLLLSFISIRFTEYWVPFTILFCAIITRPYLERLNTQFFLNNWWRKHALSLLFVTVLILWVIAHNIIAATTTIRTSEPLEKFEQAAYWLRDNTPKKSVVFHTDWDDFPKLFYYNDHNYYIVGLDPTFMYVRDKNLYWLWRNISDWGVAVDRELSLQEINQHETLQNPEEVARAIRERFQSETVFVPRERVILRIFLLTNPEHFTVVYQDQDATIFHITR